MPLRTGERATSNLEQGTWKPRLAKINEAYEALELGKELRSIVTF